MKRETIIKGLKELVKKGWEINEQDGTIKNPETGRTIKIKTALSYEPSHPAYKLAKKQSGDDSGEEEQEFDSSGETDYFEKWEELPDNVSKLYDKYFSEEPTFDYKELVNIRDEFEKEGWTFDFGLDGDPIDLHPIGDETKPTPTEEPKTSSPEPENGVSFDYDEQDNSLTFSDGEKVKVDYDGDFQYKGEWFNVNDYENEDELKQAISDKVGSTNETGISPKAKQSLDKISDIIKNDPEGLAGSMNDDVLPNIKTKKEAQELIDYFEGEAKKLEELEEYETQVSEKLSDYMLDVVFGDDYSKFKKPKKAPSMKWIIRDPEDAIKQFVDYATEAGVKVDGISMSVMKDIGRRIKEKSEEKKSIQSKYETDGNTASGTLDTITSRLYSRESKLTENTSMKISKSRLREIVKEVIKEESEYQEFFKRALEKTGKSIPQMSDEEKKAFFDKIDAAWKGKGEKNEGNAFGAAVTKAKEQGEDSFEVGGKTYKVESTGTGITLDIVKHLSGIGKGFVGVKPDGAGIYDSPASAKKAADFLKSKKVAATAKGKYLYFESIVNEQSLKRGTKLQYDKNSFVVDYIVDKIVKDSSGNTHYILKVLKSNFPNKIKVGSTEKFEYDKLVGLIRNRVMNFVKNESVVSEAKFKHTITIDTPTQVLSKPVLKQIKDLAKKGVRSKEIGLKMNFVGNDRLIKLTTDNFQKMKNRVYFELDKRESVNETKFYAFFNNKKHEVEGKDLWDAKQKAITMLKVPKSKVGLLAIVNAKEHERGSFQFESVVSEGKKVFKVNPQIGKVKYSISSHDGVKKHKDGSDFFDIETFKNKVDLEKAIKNYTSKGFKMESVVKEGASSEELRMAKNAVKNFARYRRVPGEEAIYDLMRALKDVEREYKQKKK